MAEEFLVTLQAALRTFADALGRFLPKALSALALFVLGWLLASLLRVVVRKLLDWLRFEALLERLGATAVLEKVGAPAPHRVVAALVYWLTWAAVGLAMLEAVGVSGANLLVADFFRFLPRLAAAITILVVGFVFSTLAWRASILTAVNYRLQAAKLLGALVRVLVLIATLAMAFEQIDLGEGVLHTAFAITFGSVMFAAAIAFGLGGRHSARRYLEDKLLARGKDDDNGQSHL
jgi:hypothetical protein